MSGEHVRSQRLYASGGVPTTSTAVWASPAGYTTLLKSMLASNLDTASHLVRVYVYVPGGGYAFYFNESIASGASATAEHWVALNPGDEILVSSDGPGVVMWLSGSVLTPAAPVASGPVGTTKPALYGE